MGYISRDIANITEPRILTLAAQPNFITFASKSAIKVAFQATILINMLDITPGVGEASELQVTDPSGTVYIFRGSLDQAQVGGSVFYISSDKANTAENLRAALLNNPWIAANFEVRILPTWTGDTPANGNTVTLNGKGAGPDYVMSLTAPNNTDNVAYTISVTPGNINTDSISNTTAEIELDIYADPPGFLGQDDRPMSVSGFGAYVISLQKTYAGVPLWFDLNSIFQHFTGYNIPPDAPGWFDTGTIRKYRFVAKKKGADNFPFYISSIMYILNGYGHASEGIDLKDYTYGHGIFKLLTNKPRSTYIRGQKAFLNFIFSGSDVFQSRISYRAYSTGGTYLGTILGPTYNSNLFKVVNSCVLDIDTVIDTYPKTGLVKIALTRNGVPLTEEIEYEIRPECLHKLTQFIFLNRLGGWDAFNFDAPPSSEVKLDVELYSKTVTPSFNKSTGIETVYTTNLENSITIEGAPVTDAVAEWLKELAAARVILDGSGNYVIIEDFKLKISTSNKNMQIPTIKYHLSETFTND